MTRLWIMSALMAILLSLGAILAVLTRLAPSADELTLVERQKQERLRGWGTYQEWMK